MFNFEGDLRLTTQGVHFGNPQQIRLLKEIHRTGSITHAAKQVPMSYKAAWDAVNTMNNLSPEPLVIRVTGGKGGGGTQLTARGLQLVQHFDLIQEAHSAFLKSMSEYSKDLQADIGLLQQLRFQTSARNQLVGKVVKVHTFGVHDEIEFNIGADESPQLLKAFITDESTKLLDVKVGGEFILLIKAPNVELVLEGSVPDALSGVVVDNKVEADGCEITLTVGNQTLVSTMMAESVKDLTEGDRVGVVIDPKNIILVKI
ncbi:molybdenum-dependent transcriptional regulator [Wohlfahrtiimonas chitiniclastica]|uniref:molybdenum-dependent transcriptional regulator n=1 Tax=Wohlfahrtiimonas chitiniclastica TaxID=400946 RepID=UPI00036EB90E|nr:molybdenum-dependent transcriptional regulator [Wohlfahrtiimonas chitiniclastica]